MSDKQKNGKHYELQKCIILYAFVTHSEQ